MVVNKDITDELAENIQWASIRAIPLHRHELGLPLFPRHEAALRDSNLEPLRNGRHLEHSGINERKI